MGQALKWLSDQGFGNLLDKRDELREKLKFLKNKFERHMKENNRTHEEVVKKHHKWLDSDFNFEFLQHQEGSPNGKLLWKIKDPEV